MSPRQYAFLTSVAVPSGCLAIVRVGRSAQLESVEWTPGIGRNQPFVDRASSGTDGMKIDSRSSRANTPKYSRTFDGRFVRCFWKLLGPGTGSIAKMLTLR